MRYAIYYAPPSDHPLALAAASWLGRDAFGHPVTSPEGRGGFSAWDLQALTAEAARYGFHATLKAPFALSEDVSEGELIAAFDDFAASTAPCRISALVLGRLGRFFALVPENGAQDVDQLAGLSVSQFDRFRAPLTDADRQRRNPDELTEVQRANLESWGYPYVFEEFRFHMTLTGPVSPPDQPAMADILADRFAPFLNRPLDIDHIALFVERERGAPFTVLKILPLAGHADRKIA